MRYLSRKIAILSCLFFGCMPGMANAQATYEMITPLSFGLFAITKNDAQYNLTISENNDLSYDDAYVVSIPAPQAGELFLDGLPVETEIYITLDNGTMERQGGPATPAFAIVDFTTNQPTPAQFMSSATGTLTVLFGATLRSSGDSQPYQGGNYEGNFDLTIDF